MSPGVRTIPAAMVLPTAAAMPNHIPRTCKSQPRLRSVVEGVADVVDNGQSQGTPGKLRHDNGGAGKCKPESLQSVRYAVDGEIEISTRCPTQRLTI